MNHIGSIFAMAVCLAMSAYFSATETAFSSLNKTRLKVLADNGNKRAALALACRELRPADLYHSDWKQYRKHYHSIRRYAFVRRALRRHGRDDLHRGRDPCRPALWRDHPQEHRKGRPGAFRHVQCAVHPPVDLGADAPEFSLYPVQKFISRFIKTDGSTKMSHEELLLFMEDVEHDGGIDENEGELLRNALEFGDLTAAEILTHRIELEAVDINESHEEIAKAFTQSRFSRLLVYRDTIDQVVGVLHQKDFYINGKMTDQPIAQIMTEPLFVYQHTKIRDILKMLQHQKSHIAVVVDDFGGTLGIVTMEDILEELVGEIWDEHDEVEEDFEKLGENLYRVDCSVSLEDFMEFFDVELKSDSVSVGGWVMEQLNKVPVKGESFTTKHLEITVSELDAHRVSSITVRQLENPLPAALLLHKSTKTPESP